MFWGEKLAVSGKLTGEGEGLGGRVVSLQVGERRWETTAKDDGSYFEEVAAVPDDYSGNLEVTAFYRTAGRDSGIYLPAQSQTVTVRVSFNITQLEVSAPANAFAGQPVEVSGRVVAADLTQPRTIVVFSDGVLLAQGDFREDFNLGFSLPVSGKPGEYYFEVAVLPKGSHAGVSRRLSVNLLPGVINADFKSPGVVFLPGTVRLSGLVSVAGKPLGNGAVRVGLGKRQATVVTAADGSFEAVLKMPFDPWTMGPQKLAVDIVPDELWLEPLNATRTVAVINPAAIGLLMLALILFAFWLVKLRRHAVSASIIAPVERPGVEPSPAAIFAPPGYSGRKSEVLSAYGQALELVAGVCGAAPESHTTLREYLAVAGQRLNGAYEPFRELTGLAELVLYARSVPEENLALRSAKLLDDVKRELGK